MATFAFFVRRQNPDLSVDSICTACYQTIARGDLSTDPRLGVAERNHQCNPFGEFNYPHWKQDHQGG
jgi:hypothetical protein